MSAQRFRVIGLGRAGGSLARALTKVGWIAAPQCGRGDDVTGAARDVDLLVIATPDAVIADVAAAIEPQPGCVVGHLAGSLGLEVLTPHARRIVLHPLVALPDAATGARRLLDGAWFALAEGGDALGDDVVEALGGRSVRIAEDPTARALHHGACCVAANHVVTLLGQVERLAAAAGVPFEAYLGLARGALDNVSDLGPSGALTGPVVRGDGATIDRHRAAIDRSAPNERALYDALVAATEELARCR